MSAPNRCLECLSRTFELVDGTVIYPHRQDLAERKFWRCTGCGAYCGCHKGTRTPLGFPAGPMTRKARSKVHAIFDEIWRSAPSHYKDVRRPEKVRQLARFRTYQYLAHRMNIDPNDCHMAMFTIQQCQEAFRIMRSVDYQEVRDWWRAKKA